MNRTSGTCVHHMSNLLTYFELVSEGEKRMMQKVFKVIRPKYLTNLVKVLN